jgi:hypothetical protein
MALKLCYAVLVLDILLVDTDIGFDATSKLCRFALF